MEELRDKRGLTEAEAIARYRSRNYPRPALTADILVFARDPEALVHASRLVSDLVERVNQQYREWLTVEGLAGRV